MEDVLKSRSARDLIRKVHLRSKNADILASIITSLTPEVEGVRDSSIESIVLTNADVSHFLARYRFPKLRTFEVCGTSNLNLDHLVLDTSLLTNLSLAGNVASYQPISISQILSLIAANPHIQNIVLRSLVVNDDVVSGRRFRIPLRHLKQFSLEMDLLHACTILRWLEFPDVVELVDLFFQDCALHKIRQAIGPYIRDHFQGYEKSRARLGTTVEANPDCLWLRADVVDAGYQLHSLRPSRTQLAMTLLEDTSERERDQLCVDILALLPQERIVHLGTYLPMSAMEELLVTMPNIESLNIESLHLYGTAVSERFLLPDPYGPNAHKKFLPSLRQLYLGCEEGVNNDNWGALAQCLIHQTSDGQPITLGMGGEKGHICPGVQKQIKDLVERFTYSGDAGRNCPHCRSD